MRKPQESENLPNTYTSAKKHLVHSYFLGGGAVWGWEEARVLGSKPDSDGPGRSGQEAPFLWPHPPSVYWEQLGQFAHTGTLPPRTMAGLPGDAGARRGFGNRISSTSCGNNHPVNSVFPSKSPPRRGKYDFRCPHFLQLRP